MYYTLHTTYMFIDGDGKQFEGWKALRLLGDSLNPLHFPVAFLSFLLFPPSLRHTFLY